MALRSDSSHDVDTNATTCSHVYPFHSVPFHSNRFTAKDANTAVEAASNAFPRWSSLTIKARASYMLKFHALVQAHAKELAELIVLENGKNIVEALADVAKGNETVEWACSLQIGRASCRERV